MTCFMENDTNSQRNLQPALRSLKSVQSYLCAGANAKGPGLITQQLRASYQRLFEPNGDAGEAGRDMIFTALKISQSDYLATRHVIGYELDTSSRDAVANLPGRKYLSELIW